MKRKLMIKLISVAVVIWIMPQVSSHSLTAKRLRLAAHNEVRAEQDWPEQESVDRSYQLAPGARVEVSMIYGPVDIETGDTDTAEVHIIRYARTREDLASRKIAVKHTSTSLVIRGEQDRSEGPAKVRHRVLLKIPRRVELLVQKVNARVNVGEIDGTVRLSRINGAVKVARAEGYSEVSQVNGSLSMTLVRLVPRGVLVEHVNGAVDLRFAGELNADLTVTEFNGGVSTDVPNAAVLEKLDRTIFRARIGAGGIPISISDVNGGVRLSPAG